MSQKIQCPRCATSISVDDALSHQIAGKIRLELEAKQREKEAELFKRHVDLKKQSEELSRKEEHINDIVMQRVSNQLSVEMYKAKSKFESEKQQFELEKIRQLEEAKTRIVEEARQRAAEEYQYKMAQMNKQLQDSIKAKDELARKLEQGSQQTQGEILEMALEEILKSEFPSDDILPVPKGIHGADVIQKVNDKLGRACGQIVWETKRTKTWVEGWIQKLKDDQRAIKADLAVIVSTSLPSDVKGFAFRDGVWICDVKLISPLATALRMNLESLVREKALAVGKNEKVELLYSYLTGIEFRQRVEAIIEAFSSLEQGLKKERMAYEKIWAEREKQLKKVMTSTIGMYGDLNGLVTLPQIKMLELTADHE